MDFDTLGKAPASRRTLAGERRVVTILFSDVKGSTAMAEHLDPEDWAEIMNEAFDYLIKPVYRYEGPFPEGIRYRVSTARLSPHCSLCLSAENGS